MQTDAEIKEEQNGTLFVQVGAQKGKMKGGGEGIRPLITHWAYHSLYPPVVTILK
jgi:hypothetical protein